ncbi:putative transcription factor [Scheffersomyces coipomensis]|uniref:putative transcription factor n=1 Tax=Scheffersomyces coipomensis TaxID=1788519 RepID=UPI00315D31F3
MVYDIHNPLAVSLPHVFTNPNDFPTEAMANRFQAWRSIVKDLVNYLKEYASVQEEILRQQVRLQHAVGISAKTPNVTQSTSTSTHNSSNNNNDSTTRDDLIAINKFFLPIGNGSIQDLPTILTKYHQQNVSNGSKTLKDINHIIIPKLEELRKDLLVKIKEIKNLQNDFKTSLGKEIQESRTLLSQYNQAIELSNKLDHGSSSSSSSLPHHLIENNRDVASGNTANTSGEHGGRTDPYLIKIKLERQLKKQLAEESYLYEAYSNLQNSGGKLESIIVLEIQSYLQMFLNLVGTENSSFSTILFPNLSNGFLSKEASFEWDAFISRNLPSTVSSTVSAVGNSSSTIKNGTFIDLSMGQRKFSDLNISHFDSNLNVSVREGYLERRSKYLKSYSSGWYVLTCNYIHEFKTPDRKKDQQPVMSLPLNTCTVSDHSKDDGKAGGAYKFILSSKSTNGLIHRSHNLVFRADTYKNMIGWYNDIKTLTSLPTPSSRARFIAKRGKSANDKDSVNKLTTVTSGSKIASSSSSIYSGKSINTAGSPARDSNASVKQRPLSQATSILNANRLSSTFSQKNSQSPRLANMINSDGTIITPVETFENGQQIYPQLTPQQPIAFNPQSQQQPFLTPSGYQYYIPQPGQQPQQFYDPIQQQYYTLTPTVASQPPANHPQPQFFPSSPTSSNPPQFNQQQQQGQGQGSSHQKQPSQSQQQPGTPNYAINTAKYFPTYVQQPQIYGDALPYPTSHAPVEAYGSVTQSRTQSLQSGGVQPVANDESKINQSINGDDISTLQSGPVGGVTPVLAVNNETGLETTNTNGPEGEGENGDLTASGGETTIEGDETKVEHEDK